MSPVQYHSAIVNALTISRVPLIFGFAFCAVMAHFRSCPGLSVVACVLLALAGFSDLYDGRLARRWQVVSLFGKLADPLMDKVFFIVSFPTLLWLIGMQGESVTHGVTMLLFTILYILRDQWVTFLRAIASSYQADVSAMWLGKVRTAVSFPAAGLIYIYLAFHRHFPAGWECWALGGVYAIEASLILLNIYSCAVYTKVYWPYMRRALGR